jgi:hypothetical protein
MILCFDQVVFFNDENLNFAIDLNNFRIYPVYEIDMVNLFLGKTLYF